MPHWLKTKQEGSKIQNRGKTANPAQSNAENVTYFQAFIWCVTFHNHIHTYTFFGFFSIPQETCTHQQKPATL